MIQSKQIARISGGILFFISSFTNANAATPKSACVADLTQPVDFSQFLPPHETTHDEMMIALERHRLTDLLPKADGTPSLLEKHPGGLMEAHQLVAALVRMAGNKRIANPSYGGGMVNWFNLFHSGDFGGRRIVGQYEAVQKFVDHVNAAAAGDGSASKMLTFVGPSGTGKTEFIEILIEATKRLTASNPDLFLYTYQWVGVEGIPELAPIVSSFEVVDSKNGKPYVHPIRCPFNHDPFVLLPEGYQKQITASAANRVQQVSGHRPRPESEPCPYCHEVKKQILIHETRKLGKETLTPTEQISALQKHVEIVRWVPGEGGFESKIDPQGKNIPWTELSISPNNLVKEQLGPNHPWSYYFGGTLIRANRLFILFDEFLRQERPFRDFVLNYVESGKLQRGGAPVSKINALKIAASNTESVEEVANAGGGIASTDRMSIEPMRWSTHPLEIVETALVMKIRGNRERLTMTPLISDQSQATLDGEADVIPSPEPADFRKLFKISELPGSFTKIIGPTGRYRLDIDAGSDGRKVHIAPHTLEMMAYFAAASRMVFDPAKAREKGIYRESTFMTDAFQNPIARLKILMGIQTVGASIRADLLDLSRLLVEGDQGLSARNLASDWLTATIAKAQEPGIGNCVSPQLAKEVFVELLEKGTIKTADSKQYLKWLSLMESIIANFTVDSLVSDTMLAAGKSDNLIESTYLAVYFELLARQKNAAAEDYETHDGQTRRINDNRLADIRRMYERIKHQPLAVDELTQFHSRYPATVGGQMNEALKQAIIRYEAAHSGIGKHLEQVVTLGRSGRGGAREREAFNDFQYGMQHRLGYCPHCLGVAASVTIEHETGLTHLNHRRLIDSLTKKPADKPE